jgi:GR25 family glycosyltransferase involved in LPS biosynthesis
MFNEFSRNFIETHSVASALILLQTLRNQGYYKTAYIMGKFMLKEFPNSFLIKEEYCLNCFTMNQNSNNTEIYHELFDMCNEILSMKCINAEKTSRTMFNQHLCVEHISDRYIRYPSEIVFNLLNKPKTNFPLITFTITTCKRFDLFEKTMNSLLNCCEDINMIDEWICVDDNSSQEDRDKMRTLYPFFNFYFKTIEEKGHPQSMNIIRKLVKSPYIFHIEDDWKFVCKRKYIQDALDVLDSNIEIYQCLINKNYGETQKDIGVKGGEYYETDAGTRYYIHEYVTTKEEEEKWIIKHGYGRHCNYWPHFSFRPSIFRREIFIQLGPFNEKVSHFEMEYSKRYVLKGYKSAFFEGIYCLHTGRLTSEIDDKDKLNAYALNGEAQFSGKEKQPEQVLKRVDDICGYKYKMFVVNLDKRSDRMDVFKEKSVDIDTVFGYERYSAIEGKKLVSTPQLQRIFDGNDYNMRSGMVGCAMSHISLYVKLLNSEEDMYCILEDDVDFVPMFGEKLIHVCKQLKKKKWDILYLGHHLFEKYITEDVYDKKNMPIIEKWDRITSLKKSMGGTGGYLISKGGALKLLNFINKNGMTNGIDTVQQKSADELNVFYAHPHLIYSECYRGSSPDVDTDIQMDYGSLTVPVRERLVEEMNFFESIGEHLIEIKLLDDALWSVSNDISNRDENYYYKDEDVSNILKIKNASKHRYYTIEDKIIIIVNPDSGANCLRYFDRLKKNNIFDIEDAIVYRQ